MANTLPWMLALSAEDRDSCTRALIEAARASFATDQPHLAATTIVTWQETATAIAAGLGTTSVEWLDVDVVVERP